MGRGVKVLLDENMPHMLRHEIVGHQLRTAQFMGWSSVRNGQLLSRAAAAGFDVIVTLDASMVRQQNLSKLPLSIVVMSAKSSRATDVSVLVPGLLKCLSSLQPCTVAYVN